MNWSESFKINWPKKKNNLKSGPHNFNPINVKCYRI